MLDLGSAVGYLTLDTSGFTGGFDKANQELKSFTDESSSLSGKLSSLGSGMTSAGSAITKGVTLPLVGAGAAIGSFSLDFEDAMAKVSTIADTTKVPLKDLESAILDLSDETGVAASSLAENVYDAISAGQDTADAVAFVGNATKLATAGFTSSAASLDVLTTIMNSYGLAAEDVTHVSDVLITTQNLGKTTVDQLSQSMGNVIPIANANGVALEQLGSAYAILTSNGIATAEASTYLKGMFNELGQAGTDVSNILKEKTGKSFKELMSEGNSLGDVIEILNDYAKETGVGLSDLFGSVEAGTAALTLANKGAEEFNDILSSMENSAGATSDAYDKMKTKSFDLKKAVNELKNVGIELGNTLMESLEPAINKVTEGVSNFTGWFKSLDDGAKQTIIQIGATVAAIGPLLTIGGKLISTVGSVVSSLSSMGTALTALGGPIGIVVAAVAALAVAWATNFGGIRDKTKEILESIQEIISTVVGAIKTAWETDWNGIRTIAEEIWDAIKTSFETILDALVAVFDIFAALFKGDWEGVWNGVKDLFSTIWDGILSLLDNFLNIILTTIVNIGLNLLEAAKTAFTNIKDGFTEVWDAITTWFSEAINDPIGTITGIGTAMYEAGKSIFTSLWEGIKSIWTSIENWVEEKVNWLIDKVTFWESESSKVSPTDRGGGFGEGDGGFGGSYAAGLDYVPRDMTVRVHEGESIWTKQQTRELVNALSTLSIGQGSGDLTITVPVNGAELARATIKDFRRVNSASPAVGKG